MTETSETTVITCKCTVCKGKSARVIGDGKTFANGVKIGPTAVHNLVGLAHSPFRNSPQQKQHGPWAV